MLRDRATRSLTYNDEQFHALEKIKVAETGKRIKALLNDDVKVVVAQIAECLADWYKRAQTIYLKTQILEKDISSCNNSLYGIREHIFQIKEDLKSDNEETKVRLFGLESLLCIRFNLYVFPEEALYHSC